MNTFTLGACFQHELHTGPYFMTFAPRLVLVACGVKQKPEAFSREILRHSHFAIM